MNRRADRWIRWTTIGCVGLLALIAGTVWYVHMHLLVELHGQPGWVAALTPLDVGRRHDRGGLLRLQAAGGMARAAWRVTCVDGRQAFGRWLVRGHAYAVSAASR
jgi:hypothetical protein